MPKYGQDYGPSRTSRAQTDALAYLASRKPDMLGLHSTVLARACGFPTRIMRKALLDMEAEGLVEKHSRQRGNETWRATEKGREQAAKGPDA